MFKHSKYFKKLIVAVIFLASNAYAEVECETQSQVNIDSLKPLTMQKQNKSITTKINPIKNSKPTKYNKEYLGILKLLLPDGLR